MTYLGVVLDNLGGDCAEKESSSLVLYTLLRSPLAENIIPDKA